MKNQFGKHTEVERRPSDFEGLQAGLAWRPAVKSAALKQTQRARPPWDPLWRDDGTETLARAFIGGLVVPLASSPGSFCPFVGRFG